MRSAGHRRSLRRRVGAWVLAILVGFGVHRSVSSAVAERNRWGDVRTVLVTTRVVGSGDRLDDGDVRATVVPAAAVPDDALRSLGPAATAAIALRPGTVVARSALADTSRSPTARALAAGRVGLVVRTGDLPRLASEGDSVDVAAPGWDRPVALGATVMAVDGDAVTIAVRESEATATAAASLSGPVALLVRP